ncbi:hypothetical protein GSI_11611 [Ganoderma sinense ZZ0214-1]|uniref:Gylcosyl hydrolase 115 C-terminal domain-containing protein n=1 Tax=Ganoderma sinense ZZ0214-1 TaxID=1077348 RepID=A0A2G8RX14_9APHY|nr:hypothetical protein GSI_11611 [Ganoderma sinense ZZ0214-1]
MAPRRRATLVALSLLSLAVSVVAIGQDTCVTFKSSPSTFTVVSSGKAAPIFLSPDEWPGVQRAAVDFASDIESVTGVKPTLTNVTLSVAAANSTSFGTLTPIIVGTLGKSSLIDEVINRTKLDVSSIQGKWEAFMTKEVKDPLPGISSAYVVIGADKRGSIFALYDHSEQFGVSPWYWWADVPTRKHNALFINSSGCSHGTPTAKYRGIFLNDEQPALQNWAMEKFTNGTGSYYTGSPFNHFFYTKLFELLLRLRANYIWPAMWSSAFCVDDDQNQPLADWYGIVMGTSHEEPFMRSLPPEWDIFGQGPWDYATNQQNVYDFWKVGAERARPYEGVYTIGMRGSGDEPIADGPDIQLLEKIVADQRDLLQQVFNTTDVTTIPQVWTMYKEVEGYYDLGMQVPDDVILLWSDDNFGNVRRNPLISERNRTGGSGVYYHIDYVGSPRSYKWIQSSQIEKTFEQMSTALNREATKIWVVNVGDLKPLEMHTEFFLTYGYDASKWNPSNLNTYVTSWAQREFDLSSSDAAEVATIIHNLTQHNARRKPELWNSTTYSLVNYREADNVLAMLRAVNESSTRLYNALPSEAKAAFFQLLHHPVWASVTLQNMYYAAGLNNLRGLQGFQSANTYKTEVESLFFQDYDIEVDYHSILDGKWDHMMDQTHIGWTYFQQPQRNSMPYVTLVSPKKQALEGPMRIVLEGSMASWPGDSEYGCVTGYQCGDPTLFFDAYNTYGNRYVDIATGGPSPFTFTATSNVSWVKFSTSQGSLNADSPEQRLYLSVDWSQVSGAQSARINFTATVQGQKSQTTGFYFNVNHTAVPGGFHGFVEGDGTVSIEAAHAARNTSVNGLTWIEIPGLGRTLSGVTPWPRGGEDLNFTAGAGPSIEYDFFLFNTESQGGNVTVTARVSPSLNTLGDSRPLGIALQIDDGTPQTQYFIPAATILGDLPNAWNGTDGWVANNIIDVPFVFPTQPGAHTLKVWMIEPTVVLQKVVIDTGGVKPSYLGPPESIHV